MHSECTVYLGVKKSIGISQKDICAVVDAAFHRMLTKKKIYLVSIHVVGEQRMKTLNSMFRGVERSTDVLSFAVQEGMKIPEQEGAVDWGDIFLCPWYVRRQAKRFGVSYKEEFFRMLIHGVLHLHGYDHLKEKDAATMFSLQESILNNVL